jgi:hypothetical protein
MSAKKKSKPVPKAKPKKKPVRKRRSTPDTSDRSTRARRKPGPVPDTDWHATFIHQLREFPNVSAACIASNITRETAYTHRKLYPEFAKAWEEAEEMSVDALEEACYKRAKEGYEEPPGVIFRA